VFKKRNKSIKWAVNQFFNRSLQDLSYKMDRGISKPARIIFCMTLRCNIKCRQCAIWRQPPKDELTTNEWKKVIYDLKKLIGPYRVQLAGGEIFVRKDIMEIIRFATKNNVLTGVVSNGTMITKKLAREIVKSGLGYIHISVDGINPDTHDHIRGIPGIYEKTTAGIDNLVEASKGSGMSVCIATIIMKKNMHELADIVHWTEKKGLDGVIFNPLGPTIDRDPDPYANADLGVDDLNEINRVLDDLIKLKKKGAKILNPAEQFEEMKDYFRQPYQLMTEKCRVGVTNLSITCDGDMHTCFKMPPLGNVRDISPSQAWDSDLANQIRKQIKECTIHCSPGNFVYRRSLLQEIKRFFSYG